GGKPLPITFSSGIAVYPHDASELGELKKCADTALYKVKAQGKNNHEWYFDTKNQDK
ncbi:MAG: diguanylate cyclase, partial [Clostridia bacterium]|nr:diguanylate cyclase [Clostridia bacterium]